MVTNSRSDLKNKIQIRLFLSISIDPYGMCKPGSACFNRLSTNNKLYWKLPNNSFVAMPACPRRTSAWRLAKDPGPQKAARAKGPTNFSVDNQDGGHCTSVV